MKHLHAQLLVFLMLSSALSQASAAVFSVSGYLYRVDAGIRSEFYEGDNFLLTYEFDPLAANINNGPTFSEYYTVNGVANITIGNYQVSAQGVDIIVMDDRDWIPPDRYVASSFYTSERRSAFTGDVVSGLIPYFWDIELGDTQGIALSSDALPSSPLNLSAFDSKTFTLQFASEVTPYAAYGVQRVYGYVTNISAVPEPQSVWLWGVGVLALIGAIRVNKNSMG